jgi:hypothetical protein
LNSKPATRLRRPSVTLVASTDETKAPERNSRQDDRLDRKHHAMNGGRVR